jgi:hypothetical protein
MSWGPMAELRYSSTILDLDSTWELSATRSCRFNLPPPGIYTKVWVGPESVWTLWREISCLCRESSVGHPARTLDNISVDVSRLIKKKYIRISMMAVKEELWETNWGTEVMWSLGQKWRWGRFPPRTSVSPANLHSICFSTIIFTITRGWHNR